jgi:hypothetical protein
VVPRIVLTPAGVILVTLLLLKFAVYRLPAASKAMFRGPLPVPPRRLLIGDGFGTPSLYHRVLEPADEVRFKLPPAQKVVGPSDVIIGICEYKCVTKTNKINCIVFFICYNFKLFIYSINNA